MIFAKSGHSMSYDTVSDIETVQTELGLNLQSIGLMFPLRPAALENEVSKLLFMYDMEQQLRFGVIMYSSKRTKGG